MARAGTVAVLLPGAFYFLRETRVPPIELLRRHGVAMAVATDCNPGIVADDLAPPRAQHGVHALPADAAGSARGRDARSGARARAARARRGRSRAGKVADFVLWNVERPAELAYGIGVNPLHAVVKGGVARTPAELVAA